MAAGWRTVRVFISSTFRDMQAERDHLVRFVFPRLREELLTRRVHLVDVDLRWGVTAEEDALSVCREIIDECRPRFICMLGGRYGWTPPDQDRSITADEVHYAALDRLDADEYRYFYFRDYAATESIPGEAARAGGYREFPADDETEEMARERARKLEALKERVREAGLPVFEYPCRWDPQRQRLIGLEEFGEAVYRDLLASVDDELGTEPPAEPDWFTEENAAMEAFVEERTQRYVVGSRQALLDEMTAHAEGTGEPSVLVVTGEPGSGKSALLGRFYRDYAMARPDEIVVPHFVGASQGSTSIRQTLRRLCHELAEAAGIEDEVPEDIRELVQTFPEFLARATEQKRVVIVMDALNQLDATDGAHTLNWLPRELPEGVRVICSSLEHPALEALGRRTGQVRETICGPLTEDDAGTIVDAALARYHKRFDDAQRAALLGKPDARSPLYLLAALEELRTLGTYEEILIRALALPFTVTELFDWILERLAEGVEGQEAFGEGLVSAYTSYIALGRGGMTEGELEALCGPVDEENEFWVLHRMLRPYLMHRGELVDYFHDQLREAVERRYLTDDATRQRRHREIAGHLQERGYEYLRTLSELPYHLTHGAMWQELEDTLTGLRLLEAKTEAGMVFDLAQDFAEATSALPTDRPRARHVRLLGQAVRSDLQFIARHPSTLFQCLWNRCWWYDCDEAASHYDPPEGGWGPQGAPWEREEPRLCSLLARWRDEKEARQPGFVWVRSLCPPPTPLGGAQIMCLRGHVRGVSSVAVSPDGRRIVSGGDSTVRVWDADSGEELACLRGHELEVTSVAVSPGGRRIVSGSQDNTVRVWDADSGEELACLRGHEDRVTSVAVSPDGYRIVSGSGSHTTQSTDNTVRVWDADSGEELACLRGHEDGVTSVAVSSDGRRIVSGSRDRTVRVWDADSGEELACLRGHEGTVRSVAVSPDGRRIVSGSGDGTVRVWDADNGEELVCLRGHEDEVWSVAVSPDGRRIVLGSWDRTVRVWDANSGEELACLRGHEDWVWSVAVSPDGRRIVSGSLDGTVRVWDADRGEELACLRGHEAGVESVAVSPDGRRIVSGSDDGTVRVWDADSGEELGCLRGHEGYVRSVAVSPDGRRIVSGSHDRTVRVWDADIGEELVCLRGHEDWVTSVAISVTSVAISPDGRRIVSGSWGTLHVWDADSGEELACLRGHEDKVSSVAVSPDGRRIVSGSWDRTVRVWDTDSGEELACLRGHEDRVESVAVSPDGRRIVAGSFDRTVRVWDAETFECVEVIQGEGDVEAVAGGAERYPFRALNRGAETAIEDAATGREIAWFPVSLSYPVSHPSGRIWAGVGGDGSYVAIIKLEGEPPAAGGA